MLTLAVGCAGTRTVQEYSERLEKQRVMSSGKCFGIWDDTANRRAMVTECLGIDTLKFLVEGLTLTIADLTAPQARFEAALLAHFFNTGRSCRIEETRFVADELGSGKGYEMMYACDQRR